jgi:Protein of unknown function (DUF2934)
MLDSIHPIQDLAYRLWEEQGCPSGHDMDHWLEAERLLRSKADAPGVPPITNSIADAKNKKVKKAEKRAGGGKDDPDTKKKKKT